MTSRDTHLLTMAAGLFMVGGAIASLAAAPLRPSGPLCSRNRDCPAGQQCLAARCTTIRPRTAPRTSPRSRPGQQAVQSPEFIPLARVASGSLIRGVAESAVWYYARDGKRYLFPNTATFATWYKDFRNVRMVSDAEVRSLAVGGNVTYKPGSRLLKPRNDRTIFAVSRGGVLRPLASDAVAAAIFGPRYYALIDDLPEANFTNYTVGPVVSRASDYNRRAEQRSAPTIDADVRS